MMKKNNKYNINRLQLLQMRFFRKSHKYNLSLSTELEEIIIGSLLGDLHAEKKSEQSNTRLQFKQSKKNEEYIYHLYTLFKDYCGSIPTNMKSFDIRPKKNKIYYSIKFNTYSLPCFNKFRKLFYNTKGIKILPEEIESILTPRSLAYWIMDDGYNNISCFYLCTESFTLSENLKLKKILKNKFNLDCGVHKNTNGYRLYIFSKSKDDLLLLIKPFLIKHFYYKFDIT